METKVGFITYFDNPDDAVRKGKSKKAIGDFRGVRTQVCVYEIGRTPYIADRGAPGVPLRMATQKEVDHVYRWKNLQEW